MECRDDATRAEIGPYAGPRPVVGIFRKQVRWVVRVRLFEKFADDGALEQRFVVVLQRRHEATWVQPDQRVWFVIRVHFDVLVRDFLFFEHGPDALDEGTAWRSNCVSGSLRYVRLLLRMD